MHRLLVVSLCVAVSVLAFDPPPASRLVVDEDFSSAELGESWSVQTGDWKPVEGVLKAAEIAADQHSAAARRAVVTGDAVYELRFRFTGEAKGFHFGFDPAKGELDKKGHLFSVMIDPRSWKILKHVDKAKPKEDPNEVIATAAAAFGVGEWHTLRVTTQGNTVKAVVEGKGELTGSHPTFGVKKPALVFRCLGDGVEVDDVKVWVAEG